MTVKPGCEDQRVSERVRRRAREQLRKVIRQLVSRRTWLRGAQVGDGQMTLLTVDFGLTDHVLRLVTTFRRCFGEDAPVIVVENGPWRDGRRLRRAGLRVAGFRSNLGHGLALDWGLRLVRTQYVLICDPDAIIVNGDFASEIFSRLHRFGVAGVVLSQEPSHQRYHPICTAFDANLWRGNPWSMEDTPEYDVGGALTRFLGGLEPRALLPWTAGGWNGSLWANCFSNTYRMARVAGLPDDALMDGMSVAAIRRYHRRWTEWAELVVAGRADETDFPAPVAADEPAPL